LLELERFEPVTSGGPGDHPLTDILNYGLPVYSPETDELVRRIARLLSRDRLYDVMNWWDVPPLPEMNQRLRSLLAELEAKAREGGWELDSASGS
jgi:hypothetical protein